MKLNIFLAMARKQKQLERILLIICEGAATEPQYFGWIAEKRAYPNDIWDKVEIRDNTTLPNDISFQKPTELSGGKLRPARKLKTENLNKRKEHSQNVLEELLIYLYGIVQGTEKYESLKAVPLRYVALAQCYDELYKGVYDEIWAVFDKDGHSHHKEAFELAKKSIQGKKTFIGFSSRSFEQWILLHFEPSQRKFDKTICSICDAKHSEANCQGESCLVGYIRANYLPKYAKSNKREDSLNEMMQLLSKRQTNAFENAAWLRKQMAAELTKNEGKIYLLNPYTDVDILVKTLIGI
jgi:hypothetical protein